MLDGVLDRAKPHECNVRSCQQQRCRFRKGNKAMMLKKSKNPSPIFTIAAMPLVRPCTSSIG